MEFFNKTGKMALGSRLRMLTEKITEDAAQVYKLYDMEFHPKWFPVFYMLMHEKAMTITAIAKEIGHSHPSVSKIISEMAEKGMVTEQKDKTDGRRNVVCLSEKGQEMATKAKDQFEDVQIAIEAISSQATHDLWAGIGEWEFLLEQKSLLQRVKEQQKKRESVSVEIVDYTPLYKAAFRSLNEEWISTYFKMEAADYKALDNPEGYILEKGGFILVALYNNDPVGVCALLKMNDPDFDYEMAKMAVSPKAQGKNIGFLLGKAIVEKAKQQGAKQLYLESNTILKPAINLYHKLGFQKIAGRVTPYERCNIQMALNLQVGA